MAAKRSSGMGGSSVGSANSSSVATPLDPLRDLFEACRNGDLARVKKLVTTQNVNARDTAGRKSSPLHFAAGFGRREVVDYLLSFGANVHARDDGGLIPLHNACSFGHAEVVRALILSGSDPNCRDNWNYTSKFAHSYPLSDCFTIRYLPVLHTCVTLGLPKLGCTDSRCNLSVHFLVFLNPIYVVSYGFHFWMKLKACQ
jgi:hypothetical protein